MQNFNHPLQVSKTLPARSLLYEICKLYQISIGGKVTFFFFVLVHDV